MREGKNNLYFRAYSPGWRLPGVYLGVEELS